MAKLNKRTFREKNNVTQMDPLTRMKNKQRKQARVDYNEVLTQLWEEEMRQEYEMKEEILLQSGLEDWGMGNG